MNTQKAFLLELADLMDKYGVKDIEAEYSDEYGGFVWLGETCFCPDGMRLTLSDIRQKAEEL